MLRGLRSRVLTGLLMAAIGLALAPPLLGIGALAHAADTVRAEIGKPLQEAQKLTSSGKHKEALAKLRDADRVAAKTPFEQYQIEYVRGNAAVGAGDNQMAAKSFEFVLNSGRLSAANVPKFTQALAGMYYRTKNWPKAIVWINRSLKDGENTQMRDLLVQTYYLSGNYAQAAKELTAQTGRGASEAQLQMLANIELKQGDKASYVATLEKLAASYPKASYWADLLNRVSGKPGFSNRLGLDVMRLKLANGLISKPAHYMEMGQLSLLAHNPAEALKVIEQGYKSGALGTGRDAARHLRLKELALKNQAADAKTLATDEAELFKKKNADGLAALGFAQVSNGNVDAGLALMTQAVKMGALKHPDEVKLHLGIAYAIAGKKTNAISALKSVQGKNGAADLARYWILHLNRPL
ncbi:MAG: tetratricopeptide (TPR) repeat protein [Janthinobacterium sp.]|jgi:tetratricopeptide (TPR) repeat protein